LFLYRILLLYIPYYIPFKKFFEEKRKEGGQKVFYNFLEYIIFYKTFLKKAPSFLFSFPHLLLRPLGIRQKCLDKHENDYLARGVRVNTVRLGPKPGLWREASAKSASRSTKMTIWREECAQTWLPAAANQPFRARRLPKALGSATPLAANVKPKGTWAPRGPK
jgi:hypothetical protein